MENTEKSNCGEYFVTEISLAKEEHGTFLSCKGEEGTCFPGGVFFRAFDQTIEESHIM